MHDRPCASWAPMLLQSPRSGRFAGLLGLGLVACAPSPPPPSETEPPAAAPADATPSGAPAPEPTPAPAPTPAPPSIVHPGCFLLLDLAESTPLEAGEQPCDERTTPASTFKIPHALIALDTGVVGDPEAERKWDGTRYPHMGTWERDHSLRSAIYESVVWFFMGTAREIGRERMQEYLRAFDYGNTSVEEPIDRFWLEGGSLKVSPQEQLRFLAALYRDQLPRGQSKVPTLRELLVRPPSSFEGRLPDDVQVPPIDPAATFSAKTGTDGHGEGSVTWLVGHVACPDRQLVFVSRVISDDPPGRTSPATAHGLAALHELGVLRCTGP